MFTVLIDGLPTLLWRNRGAAEAYADAPYRNGKVVSLVPATDKDAVLLACMATFGLGVIVGALMVGWATI